MSISVIAHGVGNHDHEEDLDSRSAQIQVLYNYLRDHNGRPLSSFENLAKGSPAEIKSELRDIILLKKEYYHCNEYDSLILQRAAGVLTALYGHETPIYNDLITLAQASQAAPPIVRAKGDLRPSPDSLILDQIIRGYLEKNRNPESLDRFYEILKSGILRESGNGAGSKENAYFLLSRRYAEEADPLVKAKLHDIISDRLDSELNVGARSKFSSYLKNINFSLDSARNEKRREKAVRQDENKSKDNSESQKSKHWYKSKLLIFCVGFVLSVFGCIYFVRKKK